MCLKNIATEEEKKDILDSLGKKMTLYKVAYSMSSFMFNNKWVSPYVQGRATEYKGTIKAVKKPIRMNNGEQYISGFHFFIDKNAAKRLLQLFDPSHDFKVIEATVKKEWITEVGYEYAIKPDGKRDETKTEIVIVADEAAF